MSKKTLEDAVRGVLTEQYKPLQQWEKEKKPSIDIGGHAHDPSGPNKAHIEEDEQLDEIIGTATSFGGRHNPRRSTAKYLAGKRLRTRASLQASGNQRRRPGVYEEIKEKFMKKLSEKQSEKALGKTATGQQGETIDVEPKNQELTGPTR
jgi:hypothetical protein